MPAPTYSIGQAIPRCSHAFFSTTFSSNLTVGPVEIHSSCCREHGWQVFVGTDNTNLRGLGYEGSLPAAAGTKLFTSNSFKLCGGSGAAFAGTHSGTGTVSGANFNGTGTGTLTGGLTGNYQLTITGSFSSPGEATFTGTLSGNLNGTFSGIISGGVVTSVTYTITSPVGATATSDGAGTFSTFGGGLFFNFSGSLSGFSPPPIMVYYQVEWSTCNAGGITLQMLLLADDSLIAEWTNTYYALWNSRKTILHLNHRTCSHPCLEVGVSLANAVSLHPLAMCFSTGHPTTPRPPGFSAP